MRSFNNEVQAADFINIYKVTGWSNINEMTEQVTFLKKRLIGEQQLAQDTD